VFALPTHLVEPDGWMLLPTQAGWPISSKNSGSVGKLGLLPQAQVVPSEQQVWPAPQICDPHLQTPPLHCSLTRLGLPQAPQFRLLLLSATQVPEQQVWPGGQESTQVPKLQHRPAPQLATQVPGSALQQPVLQKWPELQLGEQTPPALLVQAVSGGQNFELMQRAQRFCTQKLVVHWAGSSQPQVPLLRQAGRLVVLQLLQGPPFWPQAPFWSPATQVPPLQQPPLQGCEPSQPLALQTPPTQALLAGQSPALLQPQAPLRQSGPFGLVAQLVQLPPPLPQAPG
jgi:hypothetical protein